MDPNNEQSAPADQGTDEVRRTTDQSRRLLITAAIATPAIIASSAQTARASGSGSRTSGGSH